MRTKLSLFFSLFVFFLFINRSSASHISGGEITYQCLDSNQYLITLNLYRDCDGITMSNSEQITMGSSCGSQTLTANIINPGGTEVSQICAAQIGQSTCNGGSLAGMEKYTYQVTATLIPCSDWVISWSTCCRNTTINIPTSPGDGSYIEATLNSILDSCNISPAFFSQPIPSVCIDQPFTYNLSASNNDGDSLVYSFIAARSDAGTPLTYTAPFSGTNPINGITLNQSAGTINFTPVTLGNFIVVVQVSQYNSSGVLIGTIMRDIQFMVVACSGNYPPIDTAGTILGLTGTALATGNYSLQLCSGGNFSFTVQIPDSNLSDSVFLTSNIDSILPGATFSTTPGNPATATISWTDSGSFTGTRNFVINAKDNVCPIPGVQTFVYSVTILQGTFTNPDITICGNQTAQLSAGGGTSFQWSILSGDSIVVGTNFSCNPCANPIATPDTTTTYVVTSNLTGGCTNKDTVTVSVVSDFSYTKAQSKTSACMQEQVQFIVSATGTYTYQWAPASIFNDATINNPIATFDSDGTQIVSFSITNSSGCSLTDTMSVIVSPNKKPDIVILADTTVCSGNSVSMEAFTTNAIPSSCGLSTSSCAGSPAQITVGNGTGVLSNTTYPAPYGNWYMGVKHQMLFTASELNSLGFQGGQITSIAMNIESISGTTIYKNFEIKMGCTALTSISSWQTGLVTVFPAQTVNIITGWNSHVFPNGFDWDGISNIIVETCFNNQPDPYTNNSPTYYTPTSFNSVIYYNADNNPTVCSSPSFVNTSINRPNVLFSVCNGGGTEGFSYSWSPSSGLDNAAISNPVATISNDTSYTVIVVDTIGGCADTASINLYVVPDFTYTKAQSDSAICLQEEVQFVVTPSAGTYTYQWSPAVIFNDSVISNPIATFDSSGMQTVYFSVSSSVGCDKADSMSILVSSFATPNVTVLGDTTVCAGSGTQLNASPNLPNYSFSWSPSPLLNNATIPDPIATPNSDTSFTVIVTDTIGGCADTVSIFLYVVPDFTYTKAQADTMICLQEEIQFLVTPSAGTYTYQWNPASIFNDSLISNPIATFGTSGTQPVYFTISNSSGCDKTDSMSVVVSPNKKPDIVILADTTVCSGTSATLEATIINTTPSEIIVGTDTSVLGNTTYPAPYGNWYYGAKHQLLFTASELNALGFQGGQIASLAFNIASVSGTSVYNNFEIKIGNTALSSLSTWQTGLTTVFPAQTINIITGWNSHVFTSTFNWDGISNIIVETCFNNSNFTNNSPTYYTSTSFNSVLYYNADVTTVCSSPGFENTSTNRPNILFSTVSGGGTDGFSYSWSPSSGLDNAAISNPVATISNDTSYTVIVVDTIGGCADTASINLYVVPDFIYTTAQSDSAICLQEEVQFLVTPSAGTYSYQWSPAIIFDDSAVFNPVAMFDTSGVQTVYFTVSSASGCDKSDSMKVLVSTSATPSVVISGDTTVCAGSGTQLIALVNASADSCYYTLKMFDSFGDGWNGASLSFFNNGVLVGNYSFSTGDSASASIPVTNGGSLSISFTSGVFPNEETYILYDAGGNIIFLDGPSPANGNVWNGTGNCPGAGSPNFSFSWSPSPLVNNASIADPFATPPSDTTLTVIVTDTIGGCADTASIFLTIVPDFTYSKIQSDSSACLQEEVQFVVTPSTGTYTYLWSPATIFDDSLVYNPIAAFDSSGIQTVYFSVSSSAGCDKTDSMSVLVSSSAKPNVFVLGDSTVCSGSESQLNVSPIPFDSCSYTLDMFDSSGDGWNGATLFIFNDGNLVGSYTFSTGNSASASIPITNGGSLSISFTSGANPAEESYVLYDSQGNVIFQDGPSPANGGVWTGTGSCPGGDLANWAFTWTPSQLLNNASIVNPIATTSSDTTFTVIVNDTIGGCADTASFFLNIVPDFTYTTSQSDSIICLQEAVQFVITPSAGTYAYQWSPANLFNNPAVSNPTGLFVTPGTQTIYFNVSSSAGCDKSDSMSVFVSNNPSPNISISGDSAICPGSSTWLNTTASGSGLIFSWSPGTFLSDSTIQSPVASPSSNITYTVIAEDPMGICIDTASITISINSLPSINLGPDLSYCDSIALDAGSGFSSYLWSTGSVMQSINATSAGIYWVKITDSEGCINSDTINISDSCIIGMNEILNHVSLMIYPNPNKGKFIIQISDFSREVSDLKIFNVYGEIVFRSNIKTNQEMLLELNSWNIGAGIYFLQIMNERAVLTKKIIIE